MKNQSIRKVKIFNYLLVLLGIVLLFNSCKNERLTYALEITQIDTTAQKSSIKLYLETSYSMKGYVNTNKTGNYKIKEVLPFLISDLKSKYKTIDLYTITDTPKKFDKSIESFNSLLRKGEIFKDGSTKIHEIFKLLLTDLDSTSVNILISDCILDLGETTKNEDINKAEKSLMTVEIYNKLADNISVAVFKYSSDFNGDWYYDRKNTGGKNKFKRPYYNEILHNRPFYIFFIGNKKIIKDLISSNIVKDYDNSHFYNLDFLNIPVQLLSHPRKGKISINAKKSMFTATDVSPKRPVTFTLGLNLSKLPDSLQKVEHLRSALSISPNYLKEHSKIEVLDKTGFKTEKGYENVENIIYENNLTHFVKISFTSMKKEYENFSLVFSNNKPNWIDETQLDDDFDIPATELEGKTFSFGQLISAFDKKYTNQDIMKINFKLITK